MASSAKDIKREAGGDVEMDVDQEVEEDDQMDGEGSEADDGEKLDEQLEKLKLEDAEVFSLEVLKIVKQAQQARGLRHGDYSRYRQYSTRRLHRVRRAVKFVQGTKTRYHGKVLKPENINDPRYLQIPLFMTERAWSYGMELKQESNAAHPRKKFHMLRKFNRAVVCAAQLARICNAVKTDARTKLEAEAYSEWMRGIFFFHKQQWKEAVESLSKSNIIYEKISATLDEDTRTLYQQRIEETNPQIRFCAYNIGDQSAVEDLIKMRLKSGSAGMEDDIMDKLDDLIAQNQAKRSDTEIHWLGKTIPVKSSKVRVLLMSVEEASREYDARPMADGKLEVLENTLNNLRDALQIVQEELKNVPKDVQQQAAVSGQLTGAQLLHSYITFLKNKWSSDRALLTIRIMKGEAQLSAEKAKEEAGKKHKPQDYVRLYDTIVENNLESAALPGVVGSALMESANSDAVLYRAQRAFYIGCAFVGVKKFTEAMLFFDRAVAFANQVQTSDENKLQELEKLREGVAQNKDSTYAYMVLSREEFADFEADIVKTYRNSITGALELPQPKPFTFDLVMNSIKLPPLDDRIAAKKPKTKPTPAKPAEPPKQEQPAAASTGIGGAIKGLFGFGRKT